MRLDCNYTYFFRSQFSSTQKGRDTIYLVIANIIIDEQSDYSSGF